MMIHAIYIYLIIGAFISGYTIGDSFGVDDRKYLLLILFWLFIWIWQSIKPIRKRLDYYTELSTWVSICFGNYKSTMDNSRLQNGELELWVIRHMKKKSWYHRWVCKILITKMRHYRQSKSLTTP